MGVIDFSDSNSSQTLAEDESDLLKISSVDKPDSIVNDAPAYDFSALVFVAAAVDVVLILLFFFVTRDDDYTSLFGLDIWGYFHIRRYVCITSAAKPPNFFLDSLVF